MAKNYKFQTVDKEAKPSKKGIASDSKDEANTEYVCVRQNANGTRTYAVREVVSLN